MDIFLSNLGPPVHGMTWPNFKMGFPSSRNYFYKHPPKYTHTCVFMTILNPIKLTRLTITAPVVFKLEYGEDGVPQCCDGPSYFTVTYIQYILLDDLMNNFKALLLACVIRGKGRGALCVKHSIS